MTGTDRSNNTTWLSALAEAAKSQQIELPSFDVYGMGALRSAASADGRFVTLKRRIGVAKQLETEGVEWALWAERTDHAIPVAIFREALQPAQENVGLVLPLLKGWLVDGWTQEETVAAVGKHPRAQPVKAPPPLQTAKQE